MVSHVRRGKPLPKTQPVERATNAAQTNAAQTNAAQTNAAQTNAAQSQTAGGVSPAEAKRLVDSEGATVTSAQPHKRPGARAILDLREWQPAALESALIADIKMAFSLLQTLPPAVTFFGGARIDHADPFYEQAKDIGRWLAVAGVPVRTGAGPGIMAAAAEGYQEVHSGGHVLPEAALAKLAELAHLFEARIAGVSPQADVDDKRTQGFNIALPYEQAVAAAIEVHAEIVLFPYRKVALYENARGLITFPGGYGTLDELFEVWKLGADGKHADPMLAFGKSFWQPLFDVIQQVAVDAPGRQLISPAQMGMMKASDDTGEIVEHLGKARGVRGFERDPQALVDELGVEIADAVRRLDELPTAVTFIGGSRLRADDPACRAATAVAAAVTKDGAATRVGGDGVIAEAIVKGARSADAEATVQAFLLKDAVDRDVPGLQVEHEVEHFVTHKELIGRRAKAFVALPGGLGTLDELFTVLCQVQCDKLPDTPIVLLGKDYWQPLMEQVKAQMLNGDRKTISPEDLDLFVITDDPALASAVALGEVSLVEAKRHPAAAGVRADAHV